MAAHSSKISVVELWAKLGCVQFSLEDGRLPQLGHIRDTHCVLCSNCAEHRMCLVFRLCWTSDVRSWIFVSVGSLYRFAVHLEKGIVFLFFARQISVHTRQLCVAFPHSAKIDGKSFPTKIILFESIWLCWLQKYKVYRQTKHITLYNIVIHFSFQQDHNEAPLKRNINEHNTIGKRILSFSEMSPIHKYLLK